MLIVEVPPSMRTIESEEKPFFISAETLISSVPSEIRIQSLPRMPWPADEETRRVGESMTRI